MEILSQHHCNSLSINEKHNSKPITTQVYSAITNTNSTTSNRCNPTDLVVKNNYINSNIFDQCRILIQPRTYPNNTLIVDLNKCHQNLTNFWSNPHSTTTHTTITAAIDSLKTCWPLLTSCRKQSCNAQDNHGNNNNNNNNLASDELEKREIPSTHKYQQQQHLDQSNIFTSASSAPVTSTTYCSPITNHHQQQQENFKQNKVKYDSACGKRAKSKKRRRNFYMPESLLRTNVKLKSDDYDKALSVLTNDVRYQLHLLLYRRVQAIWLLLSTLLCLVIPLVLLTSLEHLIVAGTCVVWAVFQLIGYVVTTQLRKKLDEMLEKSVAQVNTFFMDYNLMLGVINFGSLLSKAKLTIPMLYFDTSQCREQIESIISIDSRRGNDAAGNIKSDNNDNILDYSKIDLPALVKPNLMAFAQSQLAKKIVLRYSQRWISYFEKRKLMFTDDKVKPRHLSTGKCLCQFVEEHFKNVPKCDKSSSSSSSSSDKLQLPQQPQSKLTSIIGNNSYVANTKVNLIFNDKHQQVEEQVEDTQITSAQTLYSCRPTNLVKNSTITTLSGFVDARSKQADCFKIDMNENDNTTNANNSNNLSQSTDDEYYNDEEHQYKLSKSTGTLTNFNNNHILNDKSFYLNSRHQKIGDNIALTIDTPPLAQEAYEPQHSPNQPESPELSLDLISNSQLDLVKKLRLLLELRKNDLQGLNHETLFSDILYKAPQQFTTLMPTNRLDSESTNSSSNVDNDILVLDGKAPQNDAKLNSTRVKLDSISAGKKFFSQKDSLMFFGNHGVKKNQQQQDTRTRNHVLEIC